MSLEDSFVTFLLKNKLDPYTSTEEDLKLWEKALREQRGAMDLWIESLQEIDKSKLVEINQIEDFGRKFRLGLKTFEAFFNGNRVLKALRDDWIPAVEYRFGAKNSVPLDVVLMAGGKGSKGMSFDEIRKHDLLDRNALDQERQDLDNNLIKWGKTLLTFLASQPAVAKTEQLTTEIQGALKELAKLSSVLDDIGSKLVTFQETREALREKQEEFHKSAAQVRQLERDLLESRSPSDSATASSEGTTHKDKRGGRRRDVAEDRASVLSQLFPDSVQKEGQKEEESLSSSPPSLPLPASPTTLKQTLPPQSPFGGSVSEDVGLGSGETTEEEESSSEGESEDEGDEGGEKKERKERKIELQKKEEKESQARFHFGFPKSDPLSGKLALGGGEGYQKGKARIKKEPVNITLLLLMSQLRILKVQVESRIKSYNVTKAQWVVNLRLLLYLVVYAMLDANIKELLRATTERGTSELLSREEYRKAIGENRRLISDAKAKFTEQNQEIDQEYRKASANFERSSANFFKLVQATKDKIQEGRTRLEKAEGDKIYEKWKWMKPQTSQDEDKTWEERGVEFALMLAQTVLSPEMLRIRDLRMKNALEETAITGSVTNRCTKTGTEYLKRFEDHDDLEEPARQVTLREYQHLIGLLGDANLNLKTGVFLNYQPGAGKTLAWVNYLATFIKTRHQAQLKPISDSPASKYTDNALILLPNASLFGTWEKEINSLFRNPEFSRLFSWDFTDREASTVLLQVRSRNPKDRFLFYVVLQSYVATLLSKTSAIRKKLDKRGGWISLAALYRKTGWSPQQEKEKHYGALHSLTPSEPSVQDHFVFPEAGLVCVDEFHNFQNPKDVPKPMQKNVLSWAQGMYMLKVAKKSALSGTLISDENQSMDGIRLLNILLPFGSPRIPGGMWRQLWTKAQEKEAESETKKANAVEVPIVKALLAKGEGEFRKYYSGLISTMTLEQDPSSFPTKFNSCDIQSLPPDRTLLKEGKVKGECEIVIQGETAVATAGSKDQKDRLYPNFSSPLLDAIPVLVAHQKVGKGKSKAKAKSKPKAKKVKKKDEEDEDEEQEEQEEQEEEVSEQEMEATDDDDDDDDNEEDAEDDDTNKSKISSPPPSVLPPAAAAIASVTGKVKEETKAPTKAKAPTKTKTKGGGEIKEEKSKKKQDPKPDQKQKQKVAKPSYAKLWSSGSGPSLMKLRLLAAQKLIEENRQQKEKDKWQVFTGTKDYKSFAQGLIQAKGGTAGWGWKWPVYPFEDAVSEITKYFSQRRQVIESRYRKLQERLAKLDPSSSNEDDQKAKALMEKINSLQELWGDPEDIANEWYKTHGPPLDDSQLRTIAYLPHFTADKEKEVFASFGPKLAAFWTRKRKVFAPTQTQGGGEGDVDESKGRGALKISGPVIRTFVLNFMLALFNHPYNNFGRYFPVFWGDNSTKEGLTLLMTRRVIMLSPPRTGGLFGQVEARSKRFCSLGFEYDPSDWWVKVYVILLAASEDAFRNVDRSDKYKDIQKWEKLKKPSLAQQLLAIFERISIDCSLFAEYNFGLTSPLDADKLHQRCDYPYDTVLTKMASQSKKEETKFQIFLANCSSPSPIGLGESSARGEEKEKEKEKQDNKDETKPKGKGINLFLVDKDGNLLWTEYETGRTGERQFLTCTKETPIPLPIYDQKDETAFFLIAEWLRLHGRLSPSPSKGEGEAKKGERESAPEEVKQFLKELVETSPTGPDESYKILKGLFETETREGKVEVLLSKIGLLTEEDQNVMYSLFLSKRKFTVKNNLVTQETMEVFSGVAKAQVTELFAKSDVLYNFYRQKALLKRLPVLPEPLGGKGILPTDIESESIPGAGRTPNKRLTDVLATSSSES